MATTSPLMPVWVGEDELSPLWLQDRLQDPSITKAVVKDISNATRQGERPRNGATLKITISRAGNGNGNGNRDRDRDRDNSDEEEEARVHSKAKAKAGTSMDSDTDTNTSFSSLPPGVSTLVLKQALQTPQ
eukprot:945347_1